MCMRARRTIAAEWGEGSAGGCHLHPDTWKKNPCFHLKLKAPGPTRVRVVLSRPDKDWRAACHSDRVGCMMGFYLLQGSRPVRTPGALFHEGRPWDESPFVPTHSATFDWDPVLSIQYESALSMTARCSDMHSI
eukprot:1510-Heterococcus_DN1.PRE.4